MIESNTLRHVLLAEIPVVRCPHCGAEQQWDDYYDLHAGSSQDCEKCEKEIHVLSVDVVIYARISTTPDPPSDAWDAMQGD